jgi:acyl-coenzyme A thioesterase 13
MTYTEQLANIQKHTGREFKSTSSPFMRWLNPVVVSAEKGKLVFEYTIRHEMANSMGILHGGVIAAIIDDTVAATVSTFNEEYFYVTISNTIDYFHQAKLYDVVRAETSIVKKGKQLVNIECKLWNEKKTHLIAKGYSKLLKTDKQKTNL